jgi:hypothetical protein
VRDARDEQQQHEAGCTHTPCEERSRDRKRHEKHGSR